MSMKEVVVKYQGEEEFKTAYYLLVGLGYSEGHSYSASNLFAMMGERESGYIGVDVERDILGLFFLDGTEVVASGINDLASQVTQHIPL